MTESGTKQAFEATINILCEITAKEVPLSYHQVDYDLLSYENLEILTPVMHAVKAVLQQIEHVFIESRTSQLNELDTLQAASKDPFIRGFFIENLFMDWEIEFKTLIYNLNLPSIDTPEKWKEFIYTFLFYVFWR